MRRIAVQIRGRIHAVIRALQHDGRHGYIRLPGQMRLDGRERRIARNKAKAVPVGMDHNIDKIGIVKGGSTQRKGFAAEGPAWRPDLPDIFADTPAIFDKRLATARGMEVILIQ